MLLSDSWRIGRILVLQKRCAYVYSSDVTDAYIDRFFYTLAPVPLSSVFLHFYHRFAVSSIDAFARFRRIFKKKSTTSIFRAMYFSTGCRHVSPRKRLSYIHREFSRLQFFRSMNESVTPKFKYAVHGSASSSLLSQKFTKRQERTSNDAHVYIYGTEPNTRIYNTHIRVYRFNILSYNINKC